MLHDNYCRLCASTVELIEIFDEQGVRWNIAPIISSHFQFKIELEDNFSNKICTSCWWKVDSFHAFYLNILQAQVEIQKYLELDDLIVQDHCTDDYKKVDIEQLNNIKPVQLTTVNAAKNEIETEEILYSPVNDEIVQDSHFATENDDYETKSLERYELKVENSVEIISENTNTIKDEKLNETNEFELKEETTTTKVNEIDKKLSSKKSTKSKLRIPKRDQAESLSEDELIRNWCGMECTICLLSFERFTEIKIHYRDVHQLNGYIICCNKKFFRRVRALEHIARHINPNQFRCDICQKNFADKPGLLYHMDSHIPVEERQFHCDKCPKCFAKKFQLDQHMRLHHSTKQMKKCICDQCNKGFSSKSAVLNHVRAVHLDHKRYICDICAKTFKSKAFFEFHCLEHSQVKRPKAQCPICHSWLKHAQSLRTHMYTHSDPETIHKCEFCGKVSPSRRALVCHQKYVHFSDRQHKCHVCEKAFKRAVALKEHLTLHTGEILYTCTYCPKTFNSKANMFSHRKKIHTVEWERDKMKRML